MSIDILALTGAGAEGLDRMRIRIGINDDLTNNWRAFMAGVYHTETE